VKQKWGVHSGELTLGCYISEVRMNNSGGLPLIFICTSHAEGAAAVGDLKRAVSCGHKSANIAEL